MTTNFTGHDLEAFLYEVFMRLADVFTGALETVCRRKVDQTER